MVTIKPLAEKAVVEFDPGDGSGIEKYTLRRVHPTKAHALQAISGTDLELSRNLFIWMIEDWDGPMAGNEPAPVTDEFKGALFDMGATGDENSPNAKRINFLLEAVYDTATWGEVDVEAVAKNSNGSPRGKGRVAASA